MNQLSIYAILIISIPTLVATIWLLCFGLRVSLCRRRMKSYNQFVKEQYTLCGESTPSLILRIQNEYISAYNLLTKKWLGVLFWMRECPEMNGQISAEFKPQEVRRDLQSSTIGKAIIDELNEELVEIPNAKRWRRIINTIVGWLGISLTGGLLAWTAGVDLYEKHLELFIAFVLAIPLFVVVNHQMNRWAKRVEAERLRVVSGFEVSSAPSVLCGRTPISVSRPMPQVVVANTMSAVPVGRKKYVLTTTENKLSRRQDCSPQNKASYPKRRRA